MKDRSLEKLKRYNKMFFVDAETDGLYGDFISIAAIVVDDTGREIDVFYKAAKNICERENHIDWVKENVLPYLGACQWVASEDELISSFWEFWMKYKQESLCIADVPYPVEFRLFQRCVEQDIQIRSKDAPYPFLDISSMLYVKGIDPNVERRKLIDKNTGILHNALDDVRMNINIWKRIRGDSTFII